MENHPEKPLTLTRGAWGPDSAAWVARAVQQASVEDLRREVAAGSAQLWEVRDGDAVRAVFLLRVEHNAAGSEGVILAAAGGVPGVDLTRQVLPHVERLFLNCRSVRIHTARPGLARKLAGMGYEPAEIVLVKELRNGAL